MLKQKEIPTEQQAVEEQSYSLEQLRANCLTLFGVTQSTFDGATYGLAGNFSIEKMKSHIKLWQKKEAK